MHQLTTANAPAYLRERGWIDAGPVTIEELSGGVSNLVLRVRTPTQLFVLKQSCPQLRTRDAWFSDVKRIYREQEVMAALGPALPPLTVPTVLHSDRANYVFAMGHAPEQAVVWKTQLLAGTVALDLGAQVGRVLGQMHQHSAEQHEVFERFADATVFEQLRIEPFYRRVQQRCPDIAEPIAALIDEMLTRREALCHGDYTPKNILVHDAGFTLVDYETAYFGDPTMDLGLLLCHLLLKAAHRPAQLEQYLALVQSVWQGYTAAVHYRPWAELLARGLAHCAVCLRARVDGTSPVDYLPQAQRRESVRRLSRRLLAARTTDWDRFAALVHQEIGSDNGICRVP